MILNFYSSVIRKSSSNHVKGIYNTHYLSKYLKVNKLEEEGKKMSDALLQFQASPHISR